MRRKAKQILATGAVLAVLAAGTVSASAASMRCLKGHPASLKGYTKTEWTHTEEYDCGKSHLGHEVPGKTELHNYIEGIDKEATCGEGGSGHKECSVCGYTQPGSYFNTVPTEEHNYKHMATMDVAATCTEDGVQIEECENCGARREIPIPATGHDYPSATSSEATVIEPTCTEDGEITVACRKCGDTKTVATIPATGHKMETGTEGEWHEATCEEAAYVVRHCKNDNCEYTETETNGNKLGHDLTTVVTKEPTCSRKGEQVTTCSRCDYKVTEKIPATGNHDLVTEVVKAPTCTEKGEERTYCKNCTYEERKEIPKTDHNMQAATDGTYTPATCTEDGYITVKCLNPGCDHTETINDLNDPATGHSWGEWMQQWGETGMKLVRVCEKCGASETQDAGPC